MAATVDPSGRLWEENRELDHNWLKVGESSSLANVWWNDVKSMIVAIGIGDKSNLNIDSAKVFSILALFFNILRQADQ